MVAFPNCKINLGLNVLRRRGDGYHDLETLFYPLALRDVLEIVRAESVQFTATGLPIPGNPDANLCLKAWRLLKDQFRDIPPVHIHLHKHIPMGAGLGGGSSDGAHMLSLLNKQFHLQLDIEQLQEHALQLGSDCPFFIVNRPCLGGGRGEQLQPVELDLSGYDFVLVHPDIHISTAWAFSQVRPAPWPKPVAAILAQPIGTWTEELVNDFESPVLEMYPVLRTVKEALYREGAIYASMTGSGSSFFGIFPKGTDPDLRLQQDFQVIRIAGI
jgi:4-diphosphocytidyl-2-C-methyl-D-erythritol kinase